MTSMTMRSSDRRAAPRGRVLAIALLTTLLLGAAAASSLAAPVWDVNVEHGPQNLPPGGLGQYLVQVYNVGDSASSGTTTITMTLPAGVRAVNGAGDTWSCASTRFPATTVTCTRAAAVPAATFDPATRGAPPALFVNVVVDPSASGTSDTIVSVSGGGAAGASTTADATTIDADPSGFGFVPGTVQADLFDAAFPGGAPERQADSHPFEARIDLALDETLKTDTTTSPVTRYTDPAEHLESLETKLPAGLIGNPQATPRCPGSLLTGPQALGNCPSNTQVGSVDLILQNGKALYGANTTTDVPVYNMVPPPGAVAALAFAYFSEPVWIVISLDPADHYAVLATIEHTTEELIVRSAHMTLWGVPADPAHDALRFDPASGMFGTPFSGAPIKPFLTLPSTCGVPGQIELRGSSWDHPDTFTPWQPGAAATMTGCDDSRFAFAPTIGVQPVQHTPSTPTGLDIDLSVPQKDDTVANASDLYAQSGRDVAIPTPPLRDATVVLPAGMSVSPSSADGLGACTPSQIGLGTNDDPSCPDASKLGTVEIDTPLLPDPLTGSIYLASQSDNPFGSLLALYIVANGSGVIVKLPGEVSPDPVTGQLTTTFGDNPPIPFSEMRLHFFDGPRAALVTPPTCGTMTATGEFSAWNLQLPAATASDTFTIDGACAKGFAPSFTAGTERPSAGKDSPLVTRFARSDADQELSTIDVALPPGLLGHIKDVPLCADAAANGGQCGAGSRIGSVTVAAGAGSDPFYITNGQAFMTGPYKGAPFGLSIVVPAKAGPLDLGDVVVRAQVQIDRTTAALRIVSDPMPRILDGIPLQVRLVDVTVDRPGFTFNPTSCARMSASATLVSTAGATSTSSVPFQADGCAKLPFDPQLSFTVGARHHTGGGATTPLTAAVRMTPGQANLAGVKVALPTTINARLPVISHACTLAEFHAGNCARAKAGTAVAVTPLLRDPLRGGVYFVKNGKPLPDMMVALRGQVSVDLDARVSIPGGTHLATDFATVPDVPISSFVLRLVSGSHGPLGVARDLCAASSRAARAQLVFRAQDGDQIRRAQPLLVAGCPRAKAKPKPRRR